MPELLCTQVPPSSFNVSMFVPGKGWASVPANLTFAYTQPWSEPATWPDAQLPGLANDVIIPEGSAVLLDVSPPPLGLLHIRGQLIYNDVEVSRQLILSPCSYFLDSLWGMLACRCHLSASSFALAPHC